MTWIYDVVPSWAVYALAAWFALLALWVGVRLARALHAEAFRAFDLDDSDEMSDQRARLDWSQERASRIREWREPAAKGWDGKDAA